MLAPIMVCLPAGQLHPPGNQLHTPAKCFERTKHSLHVTRCFADVQSSWMGGHRRAGSTLAGDTTLGSPRGRSAAVAHVARSGSGPERDGKREEFFQAVSPSEGVRGKVGCMTFFAAAVLPALQ